MPVRDATHEQLGLEKDGQGEYGNDHQYFGQNTISQTDSSFDQCIERRKFFVTNQPRLKKLKSEESPSLIYSRFGQDQDWSGDQETYVHSKVPKKRDLDF